MTDPAHSGQTSTQVGPWDPHQPLAAAVQDLYRACHLRPPAVLVAPSATEFVRLVLALGPGWRPPIWLLLMAGVLGLMTLAFGLASLNEVLEEGWTRQAAVVPPLVVVMSLFVITGCPLGRDGPVSPFTPEVIIGSAGPAVLGAGLGFVFGGVAAAVPAAALGCAISAAAHVLLAFIRPLRSRWAARRAYRAAIPFWRVRPLHNALRTRLGAARDELAEVRAGPSRGSPVPAQRERSELATRLEALGMRLDDLGWHAVRPALGAGSGQADRWLSQRALERVGGPDHLPRLLQAAWMVDRLADAATLFDGVAVVLPADAPFTAPLQSQPGQPAWRRSRRPGYREVITIIEDGPWLGLGVDLAWSDGLADRLLAGHIRRMADAGLRHAAIRAMGMERFIAAARVRPVDSDGAGELYLVGPPEDPLAFIKVTDTSPGPDGTAPVHWLSVPPHVATAREGVAWTFGLTECEYAPDAEA